MAGRQDWSRGWGLELARHGFEETWIGLDWSLTSLKCGQHFQVSIQLSATYRNECRSDPLSCITGKAGAGYLDGARKRSTSPGSFSFCPRYQLRCSLSTKQHLLAEKDMEMASALPMSRQQRQMRPHADRSLSSCHSSDSCRCSLSRIKADARICSSTATRSWIYHHHHHHHHRRQQRQQQQQQQQYSTKQPPNSRCKSEHNASASRPHRAALPLVGCDRNNLQYAMCTRPVQTSRPPDPGRPS